MIAPSYHVALIAAINDHARLEQELDAVKVALEGAEMQRRDVLLRTEIQLCALVDQHLRAFVVTVVNGLAERGVKANVLWKDGMMSFRD